MMTHSKIILAWKDVLALFKRSELHSFLVSVLKVGYKLISVLLNKVTWLWLGFLVAAWLSWGGLFFYGAFLCILFLAARSSIAPKSMSYFIIKSFFFLAPYAILIMPFITSTSDFMWPGMLVLKAHGFAFLSLLLLFLADASFQFKAYLKALHHAAYFLLYNYPAIVLVEAFRVFSSWLIIVLLSFLGVENTFLFVLASLLYLPFYAGALTTLYLRRVYQEGIYYA